MLNNPNNNSLSYFYLKMFTKDHSLPNNNLIQKMKIMKKQLLNTKLFQTNQITLFYENTHQATTLLIIICKNQHHKNANWIVVKQML